MDQFIILSPNLSQSIAIASIAIARLLRKFRPDTVLIAGISGNEKKSATGLYDKTITVHFNNQSELKGFSFIPTGAHSTAKLCEEKNSFRIGEASFRAENIRVSNKTWLLDIAKNLSLPIPTTWENFEDIPNGNTAIFYKPSLEGAPGIRKMAATRSSIPAIVRNGSYIFQEYIISQGTYGYAFIAKNGDILCSEQHFEKLSNPKYGGSSSIIEKFNNPKITTYSERLIKSLNYSGWGLVEYKYCPKRKDYLLMEINAKFWASLEFTFRANPQFAKILFDIDTDRMKQNGLVWPDRLLASGIGNTISSLGDVIRYPLVLEPNIIRNVLSGLTPDILKKQLKKILRS